MVDAVIKLAMDKVLVTTGAKTIALDWTWEVNKASRDREALLTEKIRASFFQDLEGIRAAPGSDVRSGLVITLAALWQAHDGFLCPDDAYAYLWAHRSVDWTDRALMATTLVALDRRLPHSFATFAAIDEEDLRELREENEWDCEIALFAALTPDNRVVHRLWFSDEVTAVAARMAL